MSSFGLGGGIASSFVVAALVAAVFLSSRLGGDKELLRRGVQVGIAFAMFILVVSATTTIIRPPDQVDSFNVSSFDSDDSQSDYLSDVASKSSGAGTVHLGVGFILTIVGASLFRRLKVIPLGLLLGGLLLLMLGSADTGDPLTSYYALILPAQANADLGWDIARLTVMLAGTVGLVLFAYSEFERPESAEEPPAPDAGSEPSPAA